MSDALASSQAEYLVPRSVDQGLPSAVRRALREGGSDTQSDFLEEYKRKTKSTGVAYLLWFFLGWHYAYFGKWGVQVLYWLSLGGLGIWAIADLFRVPGVVRETNADIAMDVMRNLRAVSG